jgi:5-methylcytosine-specific restriction endonuclease McrA
MSAPRPSDDDPSASPQIGFAERLLALLDQASVATTYKYALLLALIDATLEGTGVGGEPPRAIAVDTLARQVLRMYWPHTDPYPGWPEAHDAGTAGGLVLGQSGRGQAELLTLICAFRDRVGKGDRARTTFASAQHEPTFSRVLATATWKLAEMPLPRFQRVGRSYDQFLYSIGWDESIKRRDFEAPGFDRSVYLADGAGAELIRLAPLIRPLVERSWASRVVVYNRLPDGRLDDFLFRRARRDADRVRLALMELQEMRCFYTGQPLRPADAHVDHFLPWARSPIDAIENLVVADQRVNLNKSDHLASAEHVETWRQRNLSLQTDLAAVAATNRWESAPAPALGVARAIYTSLHPKTLLWAGRDDFVNADLPRLRQVLAV